HISGSPGAAARCPVAVPVAAGNAGTRKALRTGRRSDRSAYRFCRAAFSRRMASDLLQESEDNKRNGQVRPRLPQRLQGLPAATRSAGRRAPATSLSTARAAATMPKLAVTIIAAPKPPAQSSFTPSPTKLLLWQTPPSGL